jgi:hypothetical protein
MNLEITEVPAGDGQLLVVYVNPDQGGLVNVAFDSGGELTTQLAFVALYTK